jgi:CBS domain containing-hemolysin-like protein
VISVPVAIAVGAVCVLIQGFFSGSEIAMVSANRAKLRHRAAEGDSRAMMAEKFLSEPEVLLATTLMGTNIALVTFSVTMALALLHSNLGGGELLAIVTVTPMTLIFGELVPKTLFQQNADRIVTHIIPPLRVASFIMRPGVWIMGGFAGAMTRMLGTDRKRAFVTRDELALLIEAEPTDSSEITEEEREMIANVFELSEDTAENVMVPLSEVTAVPEDTTLGEAALEVADKQHSRMPVFRSRVDDIVGIVHVFDLLQAGPTSKSEPVSEVARAAMYVPENKPAVDLLVELQAAGNHMAIVVDEYGGAVGIVTVEDILEEIVGEIDDEYDKGPSPIRQERPGVWRVEARTSI